MPVDTVSQYYGENNPSKYILFLKKKNLCS